MHAQTKNLTHIYIYIVYINFDLTIKVWSNLPRTAYSLTLSAYWNSNIIPIFKKGDATSSKNYRPIALTVIACKVMEAIVRDCLLEHLKLHSLLSPEQHGFVTNHSTGAQLLECINDWSSAVEDGDCIDVCYIDFSKAFDSVSIPKLLQKLDAYGISGHCLV